MAKKVIIIHGGEGVPEEAFERFGQVRIVRSTEALTEELANLLGGDEDCEDLSEFSEIEPEPTFH